MTVRTLVAYFAKQAAEFHAVNQTITLRGQHQVVCIEQAIEAVLRGAYNSEGIEGLRLAHAQLTEQDFHRRFSSYWKAAFPRNYVQPHQMAHFYLREIGAAVEGYVRSAFPHLIAEDVLRRNRANVKLVATGPFLDTSYSGPGRRKPPLGEEACLTDAGIGHKPDLVFADRTGRETPPPGEFP